MINISELSSTYTVRRMLDTDIDEILTLCKGNALYYKYCEAEATREQIAEDLHITPPGIGPADKYYLGYYHDQELIAVLDLIDGYPDPAYGFIGFFMMAAEVQGSGLGTRIIGDLCRSLKAQGKRKIRLGIDQGNPQSGHFWKKNGFSVIREVPNGDWTILAAEKEL